MKYFIKFSNKYPYSFFSKSVKNYNIILNENEEESELSWLTMLKKKSHNRSILPQVEIPLEMNDELNWKRRFAELGMELCDIDLDKYIKYHGPINELLALCWIKQILLGLLYMKNLPTGKVHHCDLKPANLLIKGWNYKNI
nr:serine/threonine protein kinase,putative [Plasmodium sp. DRC-Itaito]